MKKLSFSNACFEIKPVVTASVCLMSYDALSYVFQHKETLEIQHDQYKTNLKFKVFVEEKVTNSKNIEEKISITISI